MNEKKLIKVPGKEILQIFKLPKYVLAIIIYIAQSYLLIELI